MKKNFFKKKLASALALALVVASVSPVSASAATAAKIVDKGTSTATAVLYVDKVSYGKSAVNFDLSKTYAGTTYTWTVSDSKKATIGAKTGYVVAKAPGVVKVTVTAKKGKTTTKFTQSVTIRKRATAVEAGDDFTLNAGETKSLKATLTPSTSTDAVKYVSDKEAVATVDAKTGVVTAVGAGEATITVYAKAASSAPDTSKWNVSDTVKVKVNLGVSKVEQTKAAELKLTFNGAPTAVKTTDITVVKDDTKQVFAVKSVTVDGNTLAVATFADMTDGKTYTVTYGGKSIQFTATDNVVASLSITPVSVAYETATPITISKVDAKGVVLGTYDFGSVTDSKLDFAISTTQGYTTGKNLVLFAIGNTAKATATYHTYKYDTTGNEVGAIKTEVTITAVDKTAVTVKDTKYTVSKDAPNWDKLTANTTLAIKDTGYELYFYVKDSSDTVKKAPQTGTGYTFESSNKDVLLVSDNGNLSASLTAVAQGTAYVLVKNSDGKVLWSLPVTIVAERKAASLTASTTAFTLSKETAAADTKEVKLTVKDQYSADMAAPSISDITVSCLNSSSTVDTAALATANAANKYFTKAAGKVTFNGSGIDAGTYVYKITVGDYSQVVTVTVKAATADAPIYQLVMNTNSVDVNFDGTSTSDKDITIKVGAFKGGVVASYATLGVSQDVDGNADGIVIKKGSTVVTGSAVTTDGNGTSTITFKALAVSGSSVTKAAAGSYSVEVTYGGVTLSGGFVINDTQAGLTAVREKTVAPTASTINAGIVETFKFYYDGAAYTVAASDITAVDEVVNGKGHFINTVTVKVLVNGYYVPVTVTVGQSITLQ